MKPARNGAHSISDGGTRVRVGAVAAFRPVVGAPARPKHFTSGLTARVRVWPSVVGSGGAFQAGKKSVVTPPATLEKELLEIVHEVAD